MIIIFWHDLTFYKTHSSCKFNEYKPLPIYLIDTNIGFRSLSEPVEF